MFMGITCPVHMDTSLGRARFKFFKIVTQPGKRMLFDLRRELTQLLPLWHFSSRLITASAEHPDNPVEVHS